MDCTSQAEQFRKRYLETCTKLNVKTNKFILEMLEVAMKDGSFNSFDLQKIGALWPRASLAVFSAVEHNSTLQQLSLSHGKIGDVGCEGLALVFQNNVSLVSVDLTDNDIEQKGCGSLAQGLLDNTNLAHLSLRQNSLAGEGGYHLLQALATTALVKLDLSNCNLTNGAWKPLSQCLTARTCELESLDVSWNRMGEKGFDEFTTALAANKTLRELDLSGIGIGSHGGHLVNNAVRAQKGSCLSVVRLDYNTVGKSVVKAVKQALAGQGRNGGVSPRTSPGRRSSSPQRSGPINIHDMESMLPSHPHPQGQPPHAKAHPSVDSAPGSIAGGSGRIQVFSTPPRNDGSQTVAKAPPEASLVPNSSSVLNDIFPDKRGPRQMPATASGNPRATPPSAIRKSLTSSTLLEKDTPSPGSPRSNASRSSRTSRVTVPSPHSPSRQGSQARASFAGDILKLPLQYESETKRANGSSSPKSKPTPTPTSPSSPEEQRAAEPSPSMSNLWLQYEKFRQVIDSHREDLMRASEAEKVSLGTDADRIASVLCNLVVMTVSRSEKILEAAVQQSRDFKKREALVKTTLEHALGHLRRLSPKGIHRLGEASEYVYSDALRKLEEVQIYMSDPQITDEELQDFIRTFAYGDEVLKHEVFALIHDELEQSRAQVAAAEHGERRKDMEIARLRELVSAGQSMAAGGAPHSPLFGQSSRGSGGANQGMLELQMRNEELEASLKKAQLTIDQLTNHLKLATSKPLG